MKGSGTLVLLRRGMLALLMLFFVAGPAQAEETAGDWVGALGQKVVDVLKKTDGDPKKRTTELEAIFVKSFDVEYIAKFVIGRTWNKTTPEQRQEFLAVLPDYVATIFAGQFAGYDGDGFKVTRERDGQNGRDVEGLILRNEGPNVAAIFTVTKPNGEYLITNASVEGVSLLVTKRSEFSSVIRRDGMDGLIEQIKEILQS